MNIEDQTPRATKISIFSTQSYWSLTPPDIVLVSSFQSSKIFKYVMGSALLSKCLAPNRIWPAFLCSAVRTSNRCRDPLRHPARIQSYKTFKERGKTFILKAHVRFMQYRQNVTFCPQWCALNIERIKIIEMDRFIVTAWSDLGLLNFSP